MSPSEFKDCMQKLSEDYANDPEELHIKADNLMCTVLSELGYGEGVDIFNRMEIWYA